MCVTSHNVSIYDLMMSSPLYLTSQPLYQTSRTLYLCNHTHCINITATICMMSQTVYMWHPIHYIYDIISTMYDNTALCVHTTLGICVISFALLMIWHPLYHTKPRFLWYPNHFRHNITPTVSDTTPSVSLSSQRHFVITYPLFYDIIPTLCVTPYALHIISTPYVLPLLYL